MGSANSEQHPPVIFLHYWGLSEQVHGRRYRLHERGQDRMRPLLPSMRRHRVFPAAVRSATVALVLVAMLFRTTSCGGRVEHQLGNHDHPALFFARKAGVGEGCTSTSRRRRRTISQGQARAVTRSPSACGFLTPSRPFPAIGTATVTRRVSRPAPTAVQRKASRADVEVGAITGADVDAEHSRGTLGDREERRLFLPHHQERDLREVVGAGSATAAAVVVDPMKTKLGKSELEVCRVINGLCQVRRVRGWPATMIFSWRTYMYCSWYGENRPCILGLVLVSVFIPWQQQVDNR